MCWLLAVDTSLAYEIIGVAPARVLGIIPMEAGFRTSP
jgi:hypothetical protein